VEFLLFVVPVAISIPAIVTPISSAIAMPMIIPVAGPILVPVSVITSTSVTGGAMITVIGVILIRCHNM
jgi:hypothetical protein